MEEQQITKKPITIGCITREKLKKLLQQSPGKVLMFDVRSSEEYTEKHIPSAINILLKEVENRSNEFSKKSIVITACGKGGGLSAQAADWLGPNGFNSG